MNIILLRVNLDLKDGEIENSLRFRTATQSIKTIANDRNVVVILSHRGRPDGRDPKLSLQPLRAPLEKHLERHVSFLPFFEFSHMKEIIEKARPGSILLLENLRYFEGESKNDPVFAKNLASLGTEFVNDDFATSHRKSASLFGVPSLLPSSFGPIMKREIETLAKVRQNPEKPLTLLIGGAKMSDKIGLMKALSPVADYILLGGGVALTFQKAMGMDIGDSICEDDMIPVAKEMLASNKIVLPIDEIKSDGKTLDIGSATVAHYAQIIKASKTVIWAGPMGFFEKPEYANGSYNLAKELAESRAFSIIGGGETSKVITDLHLEDKVGLLSTGGGAMLAYLAGEPMPGIDVIEKQNQ